MESDVVHIPQGSVLRLLDGEKEFLLKAFEPRGISTGCIDFQQNIVSFPQAYVGYIIFYIHLIHRIWMTQYMT